MQPSYTFSPYFPRVLYFHTIYFLLSLIYNMCMMCVLCMFVSFVNLYTVSQKSSTEGMVGSIIWILLEIYLSFQQ